MSLRLRYGGGPSVAGSIDRVASMNYDLARNLPLILPKAVAWAEQQAVEVARTGLPLPGHCIEIARRVGVARPEAVRVALVEGLPLPDDPQLREAALGTGLLGPGMVGLTLGHSIFICNGHDTAQLIAHECRHVYQHEQFGSIAGFLPMYLQQIVEYGYFDAPFEVDARNHEHMYV